jgi:acyl carrier protein
MELLLGKDAVYTMVKKLLTTEFELEFNSISPEKRLEEDLHLDSLDMVDLVVNLKDKIIGEIDPAMFKNARTVQDIVDIVYPMWK